MTEPLMNEIEGMDYISSIYRRYYAEILGFIYSKLRCREEAADVTQEAFARVIARGNMSEIQHPRGFLYKTALNLAVDSMRRRRSRSHDGVDTEMMRNLPESGPTMESAIYSKQRMMVLQKAVMELPPKCREAFLMSKFENKSHSEIAIRQGVSKNMVEKHIIKALAHCRKRLDEMEGG